jgi:hypothetical protein
MAHTFRCRFPRFAVALAALVCFPAASLPAQRPSPNGAEVQRDAMKKLAFLVGRWSGPVAISRSTGDLLHLTQTENVQFKLDGLVLLIEGQSTGVDHEAQFQALATIAYDDSSHTYRFHAYHDGHYVDTELLLQSDGFSWGFNAGPAKVQNTMLLTAKGEWQETTDETFGSNPPRRSVEMLLVHQQ